MDITLLARGYHRSLRRDRRVGVSTLVVAVFAGAATLAAGSIAYLLEPRWPEPVAAIDAPPLPIVVAGVVFNIPPAAIRSSVQRRAGQQERIDLAYQWPDLIPPDSHAAGAGPRLFVTIETSQAPLSAAERLRSIYPRYIDEPAVAGPDGLTIARFGHGTPYQDEDVVYDATAPDRFLARCNRTRDELTMAICLYERPVGDAALTFRFPRDWLADWHAVERGIDRLIEQWRPGKSH